LGCNATFTFASNVTLAYDVDVASCTTPTGTAPADIEHGPVAFWVYTRDARAMVFCTPTVEVLDVTVDVALQTGDVQNATIVGNHTGNLPLTDSAGRALNAVGYNLGGADL